MTEGGYGRSTWNGRTTTAQRAAYQVAYGEIARDLEVDHLCRNPGCVNPGHLEAVTREENIRRAVEARRAYWHVSLPRYVTGPSPELLAFDSMPAFLLSSVQLPGKTRKRRTISRGIGKVPPSPAPSPRKQRASRTKPAPRGFTKKRRT